MIKDSRQTMSLLASIGKLWLGVILVLILGLTFMVGILIGTYGICDDSPDGLYLAGVPEHLVSEADPEVSDKIIAGIDPKNIEANLRELSRYPHIAGRKRDFELVELIQHRFTSSGLTVQTTPYDVLLSYPNDELPNSVRLLDASGNIIYDSINDESNFSRVQDVVPPYNAYSPNATVRGQLVYAGYGQVEDYYWLRQQNVNVTGRLVIVKYGKIFRGDKVDNAASNGAIGVILYSDPADVTGFAMGDNRVYPDTWWLPPSGAQRGAIFKGDGDPLTPGYPANDLAYRYGEDTALPTLPRIPCHPIGYGAAENILRRLQGVEIPRNSSFQGGLNITYRTGPGFDSDIQIELRVTTRNQRAKAENVFGFIKGTVEPDRYVLFGNHRDAWIYGAIDPSSGTAVMLELARVIGDLVKRGQWKPRRTIVFCSWGAEEFGLIGSTEWVEQYVSTLRERSVAYINVDIAVQGNDTITAYATPLMYNVIHDATRKVRNPNPSEIEKGHVTVYDTWLQHFPWNLPQGNQRVVPLVGPLGSGSDFAPLLQRAGITAIDVRYTFSTSVYKVTGYSLYHTEYETFDVVKEHFDRDFQYHAAVGRVTGEMTRVLADSLILPFNVSNYAVGLELNRRTLHREYGDKLMENLGNSTYGKLKDVIQGFYLDVVDFEARLKTINRKNPYVLREVNDQLVLLEKAFLHPEGLPSRPLKKHLIFAENQHDSYAGSSFPGIVDLLFEIDKEPARWDKVRRHFHTILGTIQAAGASLRQVTRFMSEKL